MTDPTRLPPHSQDAERAVLGGILIDNDAYFDVSDILSHGDFYNALHGKIYKAISALSNDNRPLDSITVGEVLKSQKVDGALDYLLGLVTEVPTSVNTRHYGQIVHSHAVRRRLIAQAGQMASLAYDESAHVDSIIETVEKGILNVSTANESDNVQTAKQGFYNLIDSTMKRKDSGRDYEGLSTGLIDLDRILEGLTGGDTYIIAARPGMGKSGLETSIRLNVACRGHRVALFNLEMSAEQTWQRLISQHSGIDLKRVRSGRLLDHEVDTFMRSAGTLSELPIWVDDSTMMTPTKLRAKCNRIHAKHGLDLVIVDYVGLMSTNSKYGNRVQEIGHISRGLKTVAKELNVPVIILSQLSRAVEMRQDKTPQLSDLRDSGDLEQDATAVMFIYRDAYYDAMTEHPNHAKVVVAKNRHGATGEADLFFNGKTTGFDNYAREKRQ